MAITDREWKLGGAVALIAAIVGVLSSMLTLYTQASSAISGLVTSAIKREFAPVGTVVSSILPPVEFAKIIGEIEADEITKRTWVLADGRTCTGTAFAKQTSKQNVPDLRGMFLRGVSDGRAAGDVQPYATALPKTAPFTGSTSTDGAHTHSGGAGFNPSERYNVGATNYPASGPTQTGAAGAHAHSVTINGGGDQETRPENTAVYYYIKVN